MKGKSRVRILMLALILVLILPGTSIAAVSSDNQSYDLAAAKEYLLNYEKVNYNKSGEKYTTIYIFETDDDLNAAAEYIVENGLKAFKEMLDAGVALAIEAEESKGGLAMNRTATPSFVEKTVSGDGFHYVSDRAEGFCDFGKYGDVEYLIEFGFNVRIENGEFTSVGNVDFDMLYISTGGDYGDLSFPEYCTPNGAGITANYSITKTVTSPIPGTDFSIGQKSEADYDSFGIAVVLE